MHQIALSPSYAFLISHFFPLLALPNCATIILRKMLPRVGKLRQKLKQIDWNKFTITDNLLFQRVMRDKNLCKYLIEHILDIRIRDIQYLETEKTLSGQLGKKGIRLDVYLEDEQGSVFNIEMQTSDNHRIINGALETEKVPVLPLRTRYYQSLISTDMLLKGMHYWQLRKSYVIFICTFDPFRQGLPMYRFSYQCKENLSLEMGDLTENIFLNATAADKATDKELAAFLSYVNGKAAESSFTKNLDNEVKRIRDSEDWRFHAMYYEAETQLHEWLGEKRGEKIGKKIGEKNAKFGIAKNMLDKNIPIADIAEMTGLTPEEVTEAAKEAVAAPGKDAVLQQ